MSQHPPRHAVPMPPLIDSRERKQVKGWANIRVVKNHFLVGWTDRAAMTGHTLHLSPAQYDYARRLDGDSLAAYFDSLEVILWPELTPAGYTSGITKGRT